jgi:hypothetical protein
VHQVHRTQHHFIGFVRAARHHTGQVPEFVFHRLPGAHQAVVFEHQAQGLAVQHRWGAGRAQAQGGGFVHRGLEGALENGVLVQPAAGVGAYRRGAA